MEKIENHCIIGKKIFIAEEDPGAKDAHLLMDSLSEELSSITGDSGRNSFNLDDVRVPRSLFVVARNQAGEAIGCGAIRPIDEKIAEVKRMYAKQKGAGIGTEILSYLEEKAKNLGYSALWLETRLINQQAVEFYEGRGYQQIPNYGKYVGNHEAVCFEKLLVGFGKKKGIKKKCLEQDGL